MEKVDKRDDTIKVTTADVTAEADATQPTGTPLENLIAEHAKAEVAFEAAFAQPGGSASEQERLIVLERFIAEFRCRSTADLATKINFMLDLAVKDESEHEYLGRYGPAILKSMLDAPDYNASRDKAAFDKMNNYQKQVVLSAIHNARESLRGATNEPRVDTDEMVFSYVDELYSDMHGRMDSLYRSLLENRPQTDEERIDWLTTMVAYFGKVEWAADEIGFDVPELFDELQAVTLKRPVQRVPITTSRPTPKPQSSTDFSDAEKRLLDCLESAIVRDELGEDASRNEAGYALLDKIHMDACDVFHRNIDARVVAQASRPCNTIADVKDRVALLLQATYDEMDDSIVNDVFAAVRSSILTFARERVTQ